MRHLIQIFFTWILCLHTPHPVQAQNIWQFFSAQPYHNMATGTEKTKAVRNLERAGWFAIDTFVNLDQSVEYRKTDLAPYVDDNGITCFLVADVSPQFPGGAAALQKMLRDSIGSIFAGPEEGVQNSIYLKFAVEKDGSISEVEPAQQHPDWVRTAYIDRCIQILQSMPSWSPGIWKEKPVKVKMMISMNLKE